MASPSDIKAGEICEPAAPAEILDADAADPGEVEAAKAAERQAETGKYGQQPVPPFKQEESESSPEEQTEEQKVWIAIQLVGDDGAPLSNQRYELLTPEGQKKSGSLNNKGFVRVEGLTKGTCKVSFPDLPGQSWEPGGEIKVDPRTLKKGKKVAKGGTTHTVKAGEWCGSIAAVHGFFQWRTHVWQHDRNATLRSKREDPHVLGAGDALFIPGWEDKHAEVGTEDTHTFVVRAERDVLRLRLVSLGRVRAGEKYELAIEHDDGPNGFRQQHEATDDEGVLEEYLPLTAKKATLKMVEAQQTIELDLGHLCPLDLTNKKLLIKGAQQRLAALGFEPGPIDGIDGPKTQAGVKRFQQFCKDNAGGDDPTIIDSGPVDGIVGPKTKAALISHFGC